MFPRNIKSKLKMNSTFTVLFDDVEYYYPLKAFQAAFPKSFLLDALDADMTITLTNPELTHPLLSYIQLFLYFEDIKFLEGMTPAEAHVAINYLGVTLVRVVYCKDTMHYFELTEYTERKHLKLRNEPGMWYFHENVIRAYPKLLRFALKWNYIELLDFLFEQIPPDESQTHDQNIFGTCRLSADILKGFLRRNISWDQRIKTLLWEADAEIYPIILNDVRFDAIKYTPFIYTILEHHIFYSMTETYRRRLTVIAKALQHPKMFAPYLPLQDLHCPPHPVRQTHRM
jgi:hypothetical protein